MDFTFIHAADLHLDSPMKGLVGISASEDQETASFLQSITRKAFENLIETALREPVDLVLIAGDLFDGTWNDFSAGLWAARQMERLCRQDIPCCLVLGNHDRLNRMISRIPWPENVHLFASDHADEFRLEEAKVVVHGRSFPSQFCREDLTLDFPKATPGYFHIGLLHTDMGNDNQDGTYAPTNIDQLNSRQYDYWALGHVHQRQTVQKSPCWVGYPGVLQGRHIRESGAKGFYLVRLSNGRVVDSEFIESDVLRWFVREIDLTGVGDEEQFWERLQECFDRTRQENPDRMSVLRLIFKGRTSLCREWSVADRQKNLNMEIRERAALSGFRIQIEEIHWRISVPEKKNFSQTAGILGELFRALEERQDFFRQLVPSGDTDGRIEADGESGIEKVIGTDRITDRGDGIKPLDGAKINDRKSDAEVVGNAKLPDSGTAAAMERLFPKDGPTTYPMLENIPERKWLEGLISKVGNELLASDIDLNDPALLQQCYEEARQILLSSFME